MEAQEARNEPCNSNATPSQSLLLSQTRCNSECAGLWHMIELKRAEKGIIRSRMPMSESLLYRTFLDLTNDHHPSVKIAAIDSLLVLSKTNHGLMEDSYDRGVVLLRDEDELVRLSAVKLISKWGETLVETSTGDDHRERFDVLFLRLCSMVRDMSKEVRIEALCAIGKTRLVSEDILLKSLSVKKEPPGLISSAARAMIHGLEDEFYEVRRATCNCLAPLSSLSKQFAVAALELLMDMLYDDSMLVRLETLHTVFHIMVTYCLEVQKIQMHAFLSMLVDACSSVRSAARKLLRKLKLLGPDALKSAIDGLVNNLQTYPDDELEILSVIYDIGKNHSNIVGSIGRELLQQIEPSCEGNLSLDRPQVTPLLMLAIGAQLSCEPKSCDIPARIFSYALAFWGKLSCSLVDADIKRDILLLCIDKYTTTDCEKNGIFPQAVAGIIEDYEQDWHEGTVSAIRNILKIVAETWPFIQSGSMNEALRILRSCDEELEMISDCSHGSSVGGALAFASEYVQVIRLFVQVWLHLSPRAFYHVVELEGLDILLEKLETSIRSMRYRILGLSIEEELHLLELTLLSCVVRMSSVGIGCYPVYLNILRVTLSRVEQLLCEKDKPNLSLFVEELNRAYQQGSMEKVPCTLLANKLLQIFSLERFNFSGRLKYIKAELDVPGNDSENPIPFIPGLPVGIHFDITLYNIPSKGRVWLELAAEDLKQYIFVDSSDCSDEVRFTLNIPFYQTPKAASFLVKACIGMECTSEDIVHFIKGQAGPECMLMSLCNEKEVYLIMIGKSD